ncbi:MAG: S8 family serine peptidase [Woeseiaceae bacterium]|nr:S8 family serine peptidase [Woeseiaceae bacterium]
MTNKPCIFLGLLLAGGAVGAAPDAESTLQSGGPLAAYTFEEADTATRKVYIVQLRQPSAAEYHASRAAAASGKVAGPRPRFDKNSALVQSYTQELANAQQDVFSRAGPGAEQIYSYRYSLNGFAARMTAAQASRLGGLPEVARVWEDEIRPLTTSDSADFLGLFDNERGLRGPLGLDGDGVVIGVIDSGIAPEHPALADTGRRRSRGCAAPRGARTACWAAGCAAVSGASRTSCCSSRRRTGTVPARPARSSAPTPATTS